MIGRISEVNTVEVDLAHKLVTITHRDGAAVEDDIREHLIEAGHVVG